MHRDSDYRSHRISSNHRKTAGGKGDADRSDPVKYREGYDKIEWVDLDEGKGATNN